MQSGWRAGGSTWAIQRIERRPSGDCRIVIELAEMVTAGFPDELTLIRVDPRFIEESLNLGVKLDWELDADTRVFHGSTIVLQKYK